MKQEDSLGSESGTGAQSLSTRPVGFPDAFRILRPYWRPLATAFVVGVIAALAGAVQPLLVSSIVDSFNGGLPTSQLVALVILLVAGACLTAVRELIIERTGERYAYDTRTRLVRHMYSLPISRLERRERGDLVSRVTTDVSETRNFVTSGFVDLAIGVITVCISLIMMALIDMILLLLSAGSVTVILFVVLALGKRTRPVGLQMQNSLGALAECVSRGIGSMRTVRATLATDREAERAAVRAREVRSSGFVAARLRAALQSVSGISVQLLLIVVVGVGALRVSAGALTTGELSAFIMYLMMMVTPIVLVGGVVASLGEAFGSLSRILEIEAEQAEQDIVRGFGVARNHPADTTLSFRNVSFQYPIADSDPRSSKVQALADVSFEIQRGETVAFVGPSGAGKSTLFALIERFYEPTSGQISFEGQDVLELSREVLRSKLAYVDQDAVVLQGSVRENLLLVAPDATDDMCISVLSRVNLVSSSGPSALDFLDQDVGEHGTGLSGGERQRLAIARSLLGGAAVLLLDEATSSLDSRNEALVQEAVGSSDGERTTLVIAHRFSTVVHADRIIVMDEGRIVAQGKHLELLDTSSLYRDLARRQFMPSVQVGE